ncbi:MAG: trypsin-like peptidase domain-containing protein [Elusimicrobia bacterium]|nr:trypsin-like peptidase domain-containing protein [Elusimicrobiota bacterium]
MKLTNRWERVAVLATLAAGLALPLAAQNNNNPRPVHPNVIYGSDDRLDIFQVKNQRALALADSTVALFQGSDVSADAENPGRSKLAVEHYGQSMRLCKEEPFYNQPNGAFCSGSLVAPDIIMTAGHCVRSQSACEGTKFVFGFSVKKEGEYPNSVATDDVVSCVKLLGREEVGSGADWALVRIDRKVTHHKPLELNRTGVLKKGTPMFVIGHPAGLPTKVAGGATVRDETPNGYFVANLDTYGGNSGSAVFNGVSGLVEGILVRGETDYVWKDSCRVSFECTNEGCRGEDVTKISAVYSSLNENGVAKKALQSPSETALALIGQAGADPDSFGMVGAAALLDQIQTIEQ